MKKNLISFILAISFLSLFYVLQVYSAAFLPAIGGTGNATGPTKGDLLVGSTTAIYARLGVGGSGRDLTASSTAPYGVSWELDATTTISAQGVAYSGPAFVFATSGPMLSITGSGGTITFTMSSSSLNLATLINAPSTTITAQGGVASQNFTFATSGPMLSISGSGNTVTFTMSSSSLNLGTLVNGASSTITAQGVAASQNFTFATSGPMLSISASANTVTFTMSSSSLNLGTLLNGASSTITAQGVAASENFTFATSGPGLSISALTNTVTFTMSTSSFNLNNTSATGTVPFMPYFNTATGFTTSTMVYNSTSKSIGIEIGTSTSFLGLFSIYNASNTNVLSVSSNTATTDFILDVQSSSGVRIFTVASSSVIVSSTLLINIGTTQTKDAFQIASGTSNFFTMSATGTANFGSSLFTITPGTSLVFATGTFTFDDTLKILATQNQLLVNGYCTGCNEARGGRAFYTLMTAISSAAMGSSTYPLAITQIGTGVNGDKQEGSYVNFTSATGTTGQASSGVFTATLTRGAWNPDASFQFIPSSTPTSEARGATSTKFQVGLFSTSPNASGTPSNISYASFTYDPIVHTTAFWHVRSSGTTAMVDVTTTIAYSLATAYNFRIRMNSSSIYYYNNNVLVTSTINGIPASSTTMGQYIIASPTNASSLSAVAIAGMSMTQFGNIGVYSYPF